MRWLDSDTETSAPAQRAADEEESTALAVRDKGTALRSKVTALRGVVGRVFPKRGACFARGYTCAAFVDKRCVGGRFLRIY